MKSQQIPQITLNYANNGQHLEQAMRYYLTGKIEKADNGRFDKTTDCLQYQIKSARATVCKGTNLEEHINNEKATEFIYVTKDLIAYFMNKQEYIDFCKEFASVDVESSKNTPKGETPKQKMRLGHETKKMINYLAEKVR